jgi:molybdopterin-guanine dinucleotide biosynthesis protein A
VAVDFSPTRVPGLLLVGAAQRDAGKTTFACALVERLARTGPVLGVKVTLIRADEGPCPHGGTECHDCMLPGGASFVLAEEHGAKPDKDTSRLLAAGAGRVFWLRACESHLAEARDALLARLDPGVPVVCESNTFRRAVDPDLFVVLEREGATSRKASCEAVRELADLEIVSDGARFVPAPDAFTLQEGRWVARRPATVVVLAGGQSRRMGENKALLRLGGEPLVQRIVRRVEPLFEQVLISARRADDYGFLGHPVVPDERPELGPMGGIVSALEKARHDVVVFLPCDLADVPLDLVTNLLRAARYARAVVPVNEAGLFEPLVAVYRRSLLPILRAALERGERRIIDVYPEMDVKRLPLPKGVRLRNLNTPIEYQNALEGR